LPNATKQHCELNLLQTSLTTHE